MNNTLDPLFLTLFYSFPLVTIVWLLGMYFSHLEYKTILMRRELTRIFKLYTVKNLPYGVDFQQGMLRDILQTCWRHNWRPFKMLKMLDKRFGKFLNE